MATSYHVLSLSLHGLQDQKLCQITVEECYIYIMYIVNVCIYIYIYYNIVYIYILWSPTELWKKNVQLRQAAPASDFSIIRFFPIRVQNIPEVIRTFFFP